MRFLSLILTQLPASKPLLEKTTHSPKRVVKDVKPEILASSRAGTPLRELTFSKGGLKGDSLSWDNVSALGSFDFKTQMSLFLGAIHRR
jgi:hypothetical protein